MIPRDTKALDTSLAETRADVAETLAETRADVAETRADVAETLAETRAAVDETLAEARAAVDETLAEARAAVDETLAEARADVAERAKRSGRPLLAPNDPQVACNRAALEAAVPSVDELIDRALGGRGSAVRPNIFSGSVVVSEPA